jgi:tocopherol O-methyltransferase
VIDCASVHKCDIRSHYNLATLFYRVLWGPHIHHGLWETDEPASVAQQNLTTTLAQLAGITSGQDVLDVGCGMGGSAIYLARTLQSRVTGVTLSPLQGHWARWAARWHGVTRTTRFVCADAEQVEFAPSAFDAVWSIECTEHLFDKPRFFQRAAEWLRPGGRTAICAWLAGDLPHSPDMQRQVHNVCRDFLCPSLGTAADYVKWLEEPGLVVEHSLDWTRRVVRTWEICRRRVDFSGVRWLARVLDRNAIEFLKGFDTILRAYESGAMKYGCFVARRP